MQTCVSSFKREWVTFKSGGQTIFGVLHLPEEIQDAPVVIILHGFASHKVGTNRSYVVLGEKLAKEGIATLRFDFRGSGDSEGDLSEMTFSGLVSDALAALVFIAKDGRFARERVGIFGSSLGGSVGVLAATQYLNISSLVLWAPVASGMLWYKDWLANNPEKALGDPLSSLSTYRGVKISPQFQSEFAGMNAAENIRYLSHLPLLHIHGKEDTHISLLHQKAYEEQRRDSKAPSRFLTVSGGHSLGHSPVFSQVIEEAIFWYKTHL